MERHLDGAVGAAGGVRLPEAPGRRAGARLQLHLAFLAAAHGQGWSAGEAGRRAGGGTAVMASSAAARVPACERGCGVDPARPAAHVTAAAGRAHACLHACKRACVHACMRACGRAMRGRCAMRAAPHLLLQLCRRLAVERRRALQRHDASLGRRYEVIQVADLDRAAELRHRAARGERRRAPREPARARGAAATRTARRCGGCAGRRTPPTSLSTPMTGLSPSQEQYTMQLGHSSCAKPVARCGDQSGATDRGRMCAVDWLKCVAVREGTLYSASACHGGGTHAPKRIATLVAPRRPQSCQPPPAPTRDQLDCNPHSARL